MEIRVGRVCVAVVAVQITSASGARAERPEPPVVVIAPPPPEPAPPEPAPRVRNVEKLQNGGAEISFGTLFFQPSLRGVYFDGSGTPLNGSRRETFHHTGRELGVDSPLMWGAEFSLHYMRRYLAVGVLGFLAGHPGAADAEPSPTGALAPTQVNQGSITGYGAGLDLAGAVPFGIVALRPGVVLGMRGFSMPMTGFEPKTCHGKRGAYPCYEDATTDAQLFLEPRIRLVVTPARSAVSFGAYVGMEVFGGSSPTAGLFLSGTTSAHENLRP